MTKFRHTGRRTVLKILGASVVGGTMLTDSATATASPSPEVPPSEEEWWPMYLHDRSNHQYNTETIGPTTAVEVAWTVETGGSVRSSPAVVNETVYIGSSDGRLYALDMVTGEQEWTFDTGGPVLSSPAVVDGTVYIGSNDHNIYALDAETGKNKWTFETGGAVRSSPTVAETIQSSTHQLLAIGSDDGKLYLLDAETGDQRDELTTEEPVVSTAALFPGRGPSLWYVFGSTSGYRFHGAAEKEFEWDRFSRYYSYPIYSSVTAPLLDEPPESLIQIYFELFGNDAGTLRKFSEGDDPPWRFETDGKIRSSPAFAEGSVYVGSWDHRVYAIDFQSADKQWMFETDGKIESSPAVADGVLYVGSADQHVYALDTASGEPLWNFRTDGAVFSSPAVVNGTVFVGSTDGSVYALTAG